MKLAFSLIELIVCIAIVLVIAALAFPVFTSSKMAAYQATTRSNLRQLYIALELYRQGNDGADVGSLYALGLPPVSYYGQVIAKDLNPPLAGRYPGLGWYYMMPPEPGVVDRDIAQRWLSYNAKCEARSILLVDVNFSEHPPIGGSPLLPRVGIGVRLDGGLSRLSKPGGPLSYDWWGCNP